LPHGWFLGYTRRVQGGAAQPPRLICKEVLLPARLMPQQVQAYYTMLARYYPLLTDLKSFKHQGHRMSQLKQMYTELRKVCNHPHLVPEFEAHQQQQQLLQASAPRGHSSSAKPNGVAPTGGATGNVDPGLPGSSCGGLEVGGDGSTGQQAGGALTSCKIQSNAALEGCHQQQQQGGAIAGVGVPPGSTEQWLRALEEASGKLLVLDKLLRVLHDKGMRVVLLAHSPKTLDLLESWATAKFGAATVARMDQHTRSAACHAVIQ
ncbi:hypothetical protein DUNSADRAFT_8160, partial [Dunaliella salina]